MHQKTIASLAALNYDNGHPANMRFARLMVNKPRFRFPDSRLLPRGVS